MTNNPKIAQYADDIPVREKPSVYPEPFASRVKGRTKRQLGEAFGLKNFGVNMTELAPGAQSALLHRHTRQDEFIMVLTGSLTLRTDEGDIELSPGMCAGFQAGGIAHHLVNNTSEPATYLEVGDRTPGDEGHYPEDDLMAELENGKWVFKHKDGSPYA